jgi:arylsulfatase
MNNFTEKTWAVPQFSMAIDALMKTYVKYPPRKKQSETYGGAITLSQYERFESVRDQLEKQGFQLGYGGVGVESDDK